MNQATNGEAPTAKTKKIVDRSAAYPSITIEQAIDFSRSVARNFPKEGTVVTRQDIAAVLKTTAPAIQRDVATSAQYGLFIKQKEGYQISPLLKALNNPKDESDRRKNLLECFKSPKLYRDLIDKFDNHVVPSELQYHLVRDHDISERAAPEAAKIFITNAAYCGVLLQDNILIVSETINGDDPGVQYAEILPEPQPAGKVVDITPPPQKGNLLPPKQDHEENVTIRLSDRKRYAYLSYPEDITKKDIDIIRKELDVIEFRIT